LAQRHKVIFAPTLLAQLEEFGLVDQAKAEIRDAMADPERAGKPLTGSFFPYRRLTLAGRYRLIYKVLPDANPLEVQFLFCGIRKESSKKDIYELLAKAMRRGEVG
jgi:mRNA-degrading endonuclease RelE of RelBE toxin-antitoxin system